MVRSVPPGGNWKNIPTDIPSQRLAQIRESFQAGKGSRSTYYGRLDPNLPSYTIGTYFSRPGNGCGVHYQQDRMLSQREAARLQSFPDSFVFLGGQTAINKQIGNAVPPLLAYQIAATLGVPGVFVDLFAGAGGLALGFTWAGWKHLAANELEEQYAATYKNNIASPVVVGDIRKPEVTAELLRVVNCSRNPAVPLIVIGGPPCQGFSTAGKRRSMEDERNHLFRSYAAILQAVRPDCFLFENVPGLLNMEDGQVVAEIRATLEDVGFLTDVWHLKAEEFAIPQRRARVFIVGYSHGKPRLLPPQSHTGLSLSSGLFGSLAPAITVRQALDDLPELVSGQNGSSLPYKSEPSTPYQMLMRGRIDPRKYLRWVNELARA
jgi:DNA (cytosine-5)-methyltransferase 1